MTTRRHCFLIDARQDGDALVRVLTLFAVQATEVISVSVAREGAGIAIRVEAEGLDPARAETLLHRLRNLPIVISAGLGWRATA
jgi:hypothetical protein